MTVEFFSCSMYSPVAFHSTNSIERVAGISRRVPNEVCSASLSSEQLCLSNLKFGTFCETCVHQHACVLSPT
jgi:hypothetical protein